MSTIQLTSSAQNHIENSLLKRGYGLGIVIRLKTSGCNGYSYVIEYADNTLPEIEYTTFNNLIIGIAKKDAMILNEIKIDYESDNFTSGLKIINPQEQSSCGCGKSFNI